MESSDVKFDEVLFRILMYPPGNVFLGWILRAVVIRAWSELPPIPGSHDHPLNIKIVLPLVNVRSSMSGDCPECGKGEGPWNI